MLLLNLAPRHPFDIMKGARISWLMTTPFLFVICQWSSKQYFNDFDNN